MFFAAIIMVAAFYGAKHAAVEVKNKIADYYRSHRDGMFDTHVAAALKSPKSSGTRAGSGTSRHVSAGVKSAAALSTALHSLRLALTGFAVGWPHGWRHGKDRAHRWLGRQEPTAIPEVTPTSDTVKGQPPTAPDMTTAPKPEPATQPAPTGGGRVLTFRRPATSSIQEMKMPDGEITNLEQLVGHLEQVNEFKSAELEDARAQLDRAQQAAAANDVLMAGLANVKVASQSLGTVAPLTEAAQVDIEAAKARVAACEQAAATAQNALTHFKQSYGALAEAAAAAPSVPDAEFLTPQ